VRATETESAPTDDLVVISSVDGRLTCRELIAGIPGLAPEVRGREGGESVLDWRRRQAGELLVDRRLAIEGVEMGVDHEESFVARLQAGRDRLLVAEIENDFAAGLSVSEDEIVRRYELNRESFRTPERIATSFILLRLPATPSEIEIDGAMERLEEIRQEYLAGARFGELARRYSDAENANRGGAVAASARGTLVEAYEEAAWDLEPGAISGPVRLPDGVALIRLEQIRPAKELTLTEASPLIEKRLAREKSLARREAALVEARRLWPTTVDWVGESTGGSGENDDPVVTFGDELLSLDQLGLAHRPPRLAERIERELDRLSLIRLADRRGLASRPDPARRLARYRESLLAAAVLELRLEKRLPAASEDELRRLYERSSNSLAGPELRQFEVILVPGVEGGLRAALAQAEEAAASWRAGSTPPSGVATEHWGPLERTAIGASTSPRLAAVAFGLAPGEVSAPTRMESYRTDTARFTEAAEMPQPPPFEAVTGDLRRLAAGPVIPRLTREIRDEIREDLELVLDSEALARCMPGEAQGGESAAS
jgi:hypothetical protein